jgi:hypothetical protein
MGRTAAAGLQDSATMSIEIRVTRAGSPVASRQRQRNFETTLYIISRRGCVLGTSNIISEELGACYRLSVADRILDLRAGIFGASYRSLK